LGPHHPNSAHHGILSPRSLRDRLVAYGPGALLCALVALAVASVLPDTRENQRFTVLTVAGVMLLSTLAMVAYPVLALKLGWSPLHTGVLLGGTIHDVAQVVAKAEISKLKRAAVW